MFLLGATRMVVCPTFRSYATAAKSLLATLRKQTGYPIKNCKKALEVHGNDVEKAALWLNEEAQRQGWEKATQLQNRSTTQGLVGIHLQNQTVALVEVSCETDFVSKNDIFKGLVKIAASACCTQNTFISSKMLSEQQLGPDDLNVLTWEKKKLSDHAAVTISQLGENIVLRRGLVLNADPQVTLCASVHPAVADPGTPSIGCYGAAIALKPIDGKTLEDKLLKELGRQLCMHIIGMKPKFIKHVTANSSQQVATTKKRVAEAGGESDEYEEVHEEMPDEDSLLAQAYVFNTDMTVGDVLEEKEVQVLHFVRFERGETVNSDAA